MSDDRGNCVFSSAAAWYFAAGVAVPEVCTRQGVQEINKAGEMEIIPTLV